MITNAKITAVPTAKSKSETPTAVMVLDGSRWLRVFAYGSSRYVRSGGKTRELESAELTRIRELTGVALASAATVRRFVTVLRVDGRGICASYQKEIAR